MSRQVQLTFDASDPHAMAAWWAERLDLVVEDNGAVVEQLLRDGTIDEAQVVRVGGRLAFADAAAARDPAGQLPRLFFQRVPEPKTAKNRLHLDVSVPPEDLDAEIAEWTSAGATFVAFGSHPGHRWAIMRDPDGNEFCLH